MADNYVEFSQVIPQLTEEEADWLRQQLEVVYVFGDREYAEDALPDDLNREDADWVGCRAYRDMAGYDPDFGEHAGFEYAFSEDDEDKDWGRHLWFRTAEYGSVDRVAHLVQKFLKRFRPNDCWSLTWATTCSKPRVGEFGGGAVFVTATDIKWNDAYDFVEQQRAAFASSGTAADRSPVGCPQQVRRYILYDFDVGDLATTNVYDDYREAADDASELNNVIVMPLLFEEEASDAAEPQGTRCGPYDLAIDGPTFRSQRELLLKLQRLAAGRISEVPDPNDRELLDGLIELTDELADQAHDKHGVDCLLGAG